MVTAKKTSGKVPTKRVSKAKSTSKKLVSAQTKTHQGAPASKQTSAPVRSGKDFLVAVGRRKTSIARIRLFAKGSGQISVNDQTVQDYFSLADYINTALQPVVLLGLEKNIDAKIKVGGGGKAGQAIAVRHGLARALLLLNEDYRKQLRPAGFLTRDARVKERKKPGLKKARRAPQFSKR